MTDTNTLNLKKRRPALLLALALGSSPCLTCAVSRQVMKADLLDEDKVTLEDWESGGGGLLANETILMRGLVVRSRGNQIRVRLHSRRPRPGSLLLRYRGKAGVGGATTPDGRWPALAAVSMATADPRKGSRDSYRTPDPSWRRIRALANDVKARNILAPQKPSVRCEDCCHGYRAAARRGQRT